jgi:hypothetical protein
MARGQERHSDLLVMRTQALLAILPHINLAGPLKLEALEHKVGT